MRYSIRVPSQITAGDFLTPRQIERVGRITSNSMMRSLNKSLGTALPKQSGLNTAGFKRHRVYNRAKTLRGTNRNSAILWLGGNRVAARNLGNMIQTKTGVRVGRHFFAGSFITTMKNGYKSSFHRDADGKLIQDSSPVIGLSSTARKHVTSARGEITALLRRNTLKEFNKL